MNENTQEKKEYIVVLERDSCIGATGCKAVDPHHWELASDGKITLKNSTETGEDTWEKEIREEEYKEYLKAARACPVNAIHIKKKNTGERIL